MLACFKRRWGIAPALLAIVFILMQMMVPGVALGEGEDTTAPAMNAVSFAGVSDTDGTDGWTIDISGVTDGSLLNSGSMSVSEACTLTTKTIDGQDVSTWGFNSVNLNAGANSGGIKELLGFNNDVTFELLRVQDTDNDGYLTVGVELKDTAGNTADVTINIKIDKVAPEMTSLTATIDGTETSGTSELTCELGSTVSSIKVSVSEPVTVVGTPVVTIDNLGSNTDVPYGTVALDTSDATSKTLIVTPYPGNETSGLVGDFTFRLAAGTVKDVWGNGNAETTFILHVVDTTASGGGGGSGVISSETDITAFSLEEQTGPAVIDAENHTVTIQVVPETVVTNLIPTITVSDGATISPASGEAQDFTNPVTYTVTAEDGMTTQQWTVTVTVAEIPDPEKHAVTINGEFDGRRCIISSVSFPDNLENIDPEYWANVRFDFNSNESLAGMELTWEFDDGQGNKLYRFYLFTGNETSTSVWLSDFTRLNNAPDALDYMNLQAMDGKNIQSKLYMLNKPGMTIDLTSTIVAAKLGEWDLGKAITLCSHSLKDITLSSYRYAIGTLASTSGLKATVSAKIDEYDYSPSSFESVTVIFQLMDGNEPIQQIALTGDVYWGQVVSAIFNLPEDKPYTCKVLIWDSLDGQTAKAEPNTQYVNEK